MTIRQRNRWAPVTLRWGSVTAHQEPGVKAQIRNLSQSSRVITTLPQSSSYYKKTVQGCSAKLVNIEEYSVCKLLQSRAQLFNS